VIGFFILETDSTSRIGSTSRGGWKD